jgi:hypothetical protein
VLTATIRSDEIRVYLNKNDGTGDRLLLSGRDGTFAEGNPGIGFDVRGRVDPARFSFTSFSASSK